MQFNTWNNVPIVLSVKQVSEVLGVSKKSVYKLLKQDKIPKIQINKSYKIPREALRRWLEEGSYV